MEKKYELSNKPHDIIYHEGHVLHRIIALRDIGWDVKKGDKGGYVESEENLDHEGNCWIYDNAKVLGSARVCDGAKVMDDAVVKDNAIVGGYAKVGGEARVLGDAIVSGFADVRGRVDLSGTALLDGTTRARGSAALDYGHYTDCYISQTEDIKNQNQAKSLSL